MPPPPPLTMDWFKCCLPMYKYALGVTCVGIEVYTLQSKGMSSLHSLFLRYFF